MQNRSRAMKTKVHDRGDKVRDNEGKVPANVNTGTQTKTTLHKHEQG